MTQPNPAERVFFARDDMPVTRLFEGVTARLAWGEKVMLSLVDLDPGGEVPEHSHPHEQAGICIEGHFELVVNGQARLVEAGQMYIIPGDTPHAARAVDEPCKTLDIFAPPREEYKT
ncbi:MAG: cupin domain-containing protein [Phycisphaerae bacterium]|nr:cupin domain-containing protein [Phycisphaerae bacterium]